MAKSLLVPFLLACSVFMPLLVSISAQSCKNYAFSNNLAFQTCHDLSVLNSFLHYNYDSSTRKLEIAYRQTNISSSRWVAWAINPTGTGMVGAQSLVAFQMSNGSMACYTSPINGYNTRLQEGELSFDVSDLSATYSKNEYIIFATLDLPSGSSTTLNQVWQEGQVSGDTPQAHATSGPNVLSMGTFDLVSGTTSGGASVPRLNRKNVHGVLNVVSWGILMPIGVIVARYVKVFEVADPAWFYLHVSCQASSYIIGVAGWGTGLKLGSDSKGVKYSSHRTIGIVLFCLATLQVFALLLRPKKDHKYRFYWNIYHHTIGYSVIILSIINIFKGFDILDPAEKWKNAYIGLLIALAAVAVFLEAFTWYVVFKRKRSAKSQFGANGANGYGAARAQPGV